MIKAIETVYNGYRFRSRLEARWAVFFDALGIRYEYEPEGYELGYCQYLPDFYLTNERVFIEIKPDDVGLDAMEKCYLLAKGTGKSVVLISGSPGFFYNEETYQTETSYKAHTFHGWKKPSDEVFPFDSWVYETTFLNQNDNGLSEFLLDKGFNVPSKDDFESFELYAESLAMIDMQYYKEKYGKRHFQWPFGFGSKNMCVDANENCDHMVIDVAYHGFRSEKTSYAYTAARQARFEHGENGGLRK